MPLTYGSVCSGIEAASVAWAPLGWTPAWFAEIEAFPSAVLAHHWPHVENLGDLLDLPDDVRAEVIAAPDVLVGGTPCQAFSVAGRRDSLADARGALTLAYVDLADAIDERRAQNGKPPSIIVWENVPGVLNTKDNAFGCFLAGLAGESQPLEPAGPKWTNAGAVFGPKRAVAWRVLDAQYFGVAQRRRRVFVVASARDGFDPCKVLFEFKGVRRDSSPSREAREETARDAGPSTTGAGQQPYHEVAHCLNAGGMGRIDYESQSFVVNAAIPILEPGARTGKATTDVRAGLGAGDDGGEVATALRASSGGGDKPHVLAMPLNTQIVTRGGATGRGTGFGLGSEYAPAFTLQAGHSHGVFTAPETAVRRLTPTECERLQGFPDGHTLVPYRNKPAADGPRYKAIGNSMAVPVMAWIGRRIAQQVQP